MRFTEAGLKAIRSRGPNLGIELPWPDDASPIGLYETCRCPSGRPFKDCCVAFVTAEPAPITREIGAYLSFKDLWPTDPLEPGDVWKLIGRFDPQHLLQTISRINLKLQSDYYKPNSKEELSVLRVFMRDDWFEKTFRWLASGKRPKALHRLLFPALLIQVLARSKDATSEITPVSHQRELGPLALMFNQIIEDDYQTQTVSAKTDPERQRVFFASIYRQAFYSHAEEYPGSLGRIFSLIKHGLPAAAAKKLGPRFDFEKEFTQAFGMTVDEMLTYGFAVMNHYSSDNTKLFGDPRAFVINRTSLKTVVPAELQAASGRIFDYLALPWDEHVERAQTALDGASPLNMFQLYSLYDHPLIEMPDGGIYALDAQFLRARVTEGAYWALFHALRQDNREGLLRDSCGHATEWYAAELLRSCCNKEGTKNLWLDWDGEINGKAGKPDAIYREGDTLYFVEVTTSAVTAKDASSGNPVVLGAALRRLWFGEGKGSSGKLTQLARAVRNFREGKLSIGGVSPKDITTIRPMLVTLRDFPQWPRLMDWYRELMTDAGMTEAFVNDVLLIDIEELEELAARLIAGEAWGSIFAQKRLANHPDMSVHNFLWATDRLVERPPFVTKNIEDAVTAFGKSLRED